MWIVKTSNPVEIPGLVNTLNLPIIWHALNQERTHFRTFANLDWLTEMLFLNKWSFGLIKRWTNASLELCLILIELFTKLGTYKSVIEKVSKEIEIEKSYSRNRYEKLKASYIQKGTGRLLKRKRIQMSREKLIWNKGTNESNLERFLSDVSPWARDSFWLETWWLYWIVQLVFCLFQNFQTAFPFCDQRKLSPPQMPCPWKPIK